MPVLCTSPINQKKNFIVCYVKKGNFPAIAPKVSLVTHKEILASKVLFFKCSIISDSYLAANISDKSLVVRNDDNSTYKKRNKNWNVPKIFFLTTDPILAWYETCGNQCTGTVPYTTKFCPARIVITKKRPEPDCPLILQNFDQHIS